MNLSPDIIGLTQAQWQEIQDRLVTPLRAAGAKLWCFGSRARGDFRPHSDLDIMVESTSDLSTILGEIREHFESSNFPFKVDLVEKRNFADSYLPNFERDRKPL